MPGKQHFINITSRVKLKSSYVLPGICQFFVHCTTAVKSLKLGISALKCRDTCIGVKNVKCCWRRLFLYSTGKYRGRETEMSCEAVSGLVVLVVFS